MATVDLTRIGANIGALYSLQSLKDINSKLAAAQTRLSTGKRINSAADDPAGLVIATKMNTRSEGLKVAMDNISDAKNMLSVAESGLSKLTDIITEMRTKATQAASDTLGASERSTIQTQLSSYASQIDDIINETKWNGVKLLDGTVSKTFQTGVDQGESTTWSLSDKLDATSLGISSKISTATASVSSGSAYFTGSSAVTVQKTDGLSELTTGTYLVDIKGAATSATQGSLHNIENNLTSTNTVTIGAGTGTAGSVSELANGNHTVSFGSFTAVTGGSFSVNVTIDGVSAGSMMVGGSAQMAAAGGSTFELKNGTGGDLGLQMSVNYSSTAPADISGTYTFDYIKRNNAEIQFQNADGTALSVDKLGTGISGSTASTVYIQANANFDTGRGISFTSGTMANLISGSADTISPTVMNYTAVNTHSVDVSTAAKASQYMATLDSSLDVVNQSMADLGSLEARMDIKETVASSAQINVESAYNRIMNADMAEEQVNASKYQVLQQTAVAMLAQSNSAPQALLTLFK
jgi:flagellin